MSVNLSIKNVPNELVERLRRQAVEHHRSLQGELMAIIEANVNADKSLRLHEILAEVCRLGLTPSKSISMIRKDRNAPDSKAPNKLGELLDLLEQLPSLEDDTKAFAHDVERARPWGEPV